MTQRRKDDHNYLKRELTLIFFVYDTPINPHATAKGHEHRLMCCSSDAFTLLVKMIFYLTIVIDVPIFQTSTNFEVFCLLLTDMHVGH